MAQLITWLITFLTIKAHALNYPVTTNHGIDENGGGVLLAVKESIDVENKEVSLGSKAEIWETLNINKIRIAAAMSYNLLQGWYFRWYNLFEV